MLTRVLGTVKNAFDTPPLLVANSDDAPNWKPGIETIKDVIPDCGSLSGIHAALKHTGAPIFVVAWDMPFLPAPLVRAVVEESESFDVFLPESNGPLGIEPLCGVYKPSCTGPVERALERKEYRTTSFHGEVNIGTLPLNTIVSYGDPDTMFFSVNDADDLAEAERICSTQ